MGVLDKIKPGVVYGKELHSLYEICKKEGFAIPSINCIGTNSINAVLEAAKEINSPIMIQFSNSGSAFICGKGLKMEKTARSFNSWSHFWCYACSFDGRALWSSCCSSY